MSAEDGKGPMIDHDNDLYTIASNEHSLGEQSLKSFELLDDADVDGGGGVDGSDIGAFLDAAAMNKGSVDNGGSGGSSGGAAGAGGQFDLDFNGMVENFGGDDDGEMEFMQPGASLERGGPGGPGGPSIQGGEGGDEYYIYDQGSHAEMSQVSFDSANYASNQGMSQWELFLKIADEKRGFVPGDSMASLSLAGSNSQFTLQDKQEMEATQDQLSFEVDSLKERIKRRNVLIGTIREAYLKDVIEMKSVMFSVLTEEERLRVVSQWEANIPSLDLRLPIELCAPAECDFTFTPCENCGGSVEIYHRQSSRMNRLEATLKEYRTKQEQLFATNAMQKSLLDRTEMNSKEAARVHEDEKKFMYGELKKVKELLIERDKEITNLKHRNRVLNTENTQMKDETKSFLDTKDELRAAEKEIFKQTENNRLLTERVANHENKINDLEEEADVIRRESIDTLKKFNDEKETTLKLRADLKVTNENLVNAKATIQTKTSELSAADENIKALEKEIKGLNEILEIEAKKFEDSVTNYDLIITGLKDDLTRSKQTIGSLETTMAFKDNTLDGFAMVEEDLLGYILKYEEEMEELEEEIAEKSNEIEELKEYVQELGDRSRPASRAQTGSSEGGGQSRPNTNNTVGGSIAAAKSNELSSRETKMVQGLNQLKSQLANKESQYQGVMKQVTAQQDIIASQTSAIAILRAEQSKNEGSATKLKFLMIKFSDQKNVLENIKVDKMHVEADLAEARSNMASLQDEYKLFKEMHDKFMSSAEGDDSVYKDQIRTLEEMISTKNDEANKSSSEISSLSLKFTTSQKEIEVLKDQILTLKEASGNQSQLSQEMASRDKKVSELEKELSARAEKLAGMNLELETSLKANSELKGEMSIVQNELSSSIASWNETKEEYALFKISSEKTLAANTPEAIKELYQERLHTLENMVLEQKQKVEDEKKKSIHMEGKYVALEGSKDGFLHMIDTAEEAKHAAEEKIKSQQEEIESLRSIEQNHSDSKDLVDKLKKELKEANEQLEIAMKMSSQVAPAMNDADLFSEAELKKIEEEKALAPPPVEIPVIPQVIQTEVICSVCREKQDESKMNEAEVDVSQWDFFVPAEGTVDTKTGSRSGSRKKTRSRESGGGTAESRNRSSTADSKGDLELEAPETPAKPVKTEVVEVKPPSENASEEEIALREDFLMKLSGTLGPTNGKNALNGIHFQLETLGNLLKGHADGQWRWMTFAKKALDLYPTMLCLLEAMIVCIEKGKSENDIDKVRKLATNVLTPEAAPPMTDMSYLSDLYIEPEESAESKEIAEKYTVDKKSKEDAYLLVKAGKEELIVAKNKEKERLSEVGDDESVQILEDEIDAVEQALKDDFLEHTEAMDRLEEIEMRRKDNELYARRQIRERFDKVIESLTPNDGKNFGPSTSFLGDVTESFHYERVPMIESGDSALSLFEDYLSKAQKTLLDALPSLVEDWGHGKGVVFKLDYTVEQARKAQEVIGDNIAKELKRELKTMTKKFNSAKDGRKEAEKKQDEMSREIETYMAMENNFQIAKDEILNLNLVITELQKTVEAKEDKIGELLLEREGLKTELSETSSKLLDTSTELTDYKARLQAQTVIMANEHHEKAVLSMKLDALIKAEAERKAGQRSVACQRIIDTDSVSIQTQFSSTDLSIVTTVASLERGDGGLSKLERRRQFPLAVAIPSNSVDMGSTLSRPVYGQNKKLASNLKTTNTLSAVEISRIAKLTQDFQLSKQMASLPGLKEGGLGQTPPTEDTPVTISKEEEQILAKRVQIAMLRSDIAKVIRAKEEPNVDSRMLSTIATKISKKRTEIDKLLDAIAVLEESMVPRHSFVVEDTPSFVLGAGDGSHLPPRNIIAGDSDISDFTRFSHHHHQHQQQQGAEILGQNHHSYPLESISVDGKVRIASPPPHTPQSPYNNATPRSMALSTNLGSTPAVGENGKYDMGISTSKRSKSLSTLAPVVSGYDDIRSQLERKHKDRQGQRLSITQPIALLPQNTKRIRLQEVTENSSTGTGVNSSKSSVITLENNKSIKGVKIVHFSTKGLNDWNDPFVPGNPNSSMGTNIENMRRGSPELHLSERRDIGAADDLSMDDSHASTK